jgi:DNA-binding response OmpR family regulator
VPRRPRWRRRRCLPAGDATLLRKLIAADPLDLAILDIVLPDTSGWELLRLIRESDDCLVMLSGRDSDIDKARGGGPGRGRLPDQAVQLPGV